jgi:hypothetical protein
MPHSDGAGPAQNLHSAADCQSVGLFRSDFSRCLSGGRSCISLVHALLALRVWIHYLFLQAKKRRERENFFLPLQSYAVSTYFPVSIVDFGLKSWASMQGGFQYNLSLYYYNVPHTTTQNIVYYERGA